MSIFDRVNENISEIITYQPGKPISDVARELGLDPDSVAKLASNENPLGPSPKAAMAMRKNIRQMHIYPDGGAFELKKKLAKHHRLDSENFIIGNGSNEILEFIAHCFMSQDTSVVASEYAFIVYKMMAKMFGAEFIEVPAKNYGHDLTKIAESVKENTKVVFVCNPNNPTGTFLNNTQIEKFVNSIPDDVLIVFDEAYAEISQKKMPNTVQFVRERENVIVLRTFSKAYGLAGLRIGYGMANKKLISILEKPRQPFNSNAMAQTAACAALDDKSFVRESKELFRRGIETLTAFCKESGLEYVDTVANFMLIRVGNGQEVFENLQKLGVVVRPMGGYGLPEWIRISFGTDQENKKLINAMNEVIKCR